MDFFIRQAGIKFDLDHVLGIYWKNYRWLLADSESAWDMIANFS
jgi:hypothetical protein